MDCSETRLDTIELQISHDTKSVTSPTLSDIEVFTAMRAGNNKILEKMKTNETSMESFKNYKGDSVLHVAASYGHLELVKNVVSECPSLLLEKNGNDRIPLHVAARAGRSEVVKFLAGSMACLQGEGGERLDPYAVKDKNGDTPLLLAMQDLEEKTEILMEKRKRSQHLAVGIISQYTSLSKNISDESKHMMETAIFLVDANRRVSFLANKDGISPLYLAVKVGSLSLVNDMLNRPVSSVQGKYSNLASLLEGRKSLVHAALKAKNTDVLEVVLSEDANLVNERDEEGQTCISVGASVGFCQGMRKVLQRSTSGAFECDKDGSFPIHRAVDKGYWNVVEEILKHCPDSIELLNKKGQNVFHIAAENGKALTTINWRPRAVNALTRFFPYNNTLYIQNKDGLRPLDIAQNELKSDYIFRERLTLMVLLCAYKPKGISWVPTSGMTLRKRSGEVVGDEKFNDRVNVLLLVAALIATVTFAAGFTMPGGFNSSAPKMGMAILVDNKILKYFLVCDILAMQCSLVAIVALIWAQLGDQELAHKAFHLALPSLFFALCCMSMAFVSGVIATIDTSSSLTKTISIISGILNGVVIFLFGPYVIPQLHGIPALELFSRLYLRFLLWVVNVDDAKKLYTADLDPVYYKPAEIFERTIARIKKKASLLLFIYTKTLC